MIVHIRSLGFAAAVAVAALGFSPNAQAVACAAGDTDNFTTSTDCANAPDTGPGGNVRETEMNAAPGVFGITNWVSIEKLDTTNGVDDLTGSFILLTSNAGNTSGTWSLAPGFFFAPGASYAFALKGATNNVVYLMDTAFTSGNWTNDDIPPQGGGPNPPTPGLSNLTLFGTEPLSQVPLPAALPMLGAAVVGLGFLAGRRRKA